MAWMNMERKQKLAPGVKKVLAKYGLKGSLSIRTNSTLILKIKSGKIDFEGSHARIREANPSMYYGDKYVPRGSLHVNPYHFERDFDGVALKFLAEVLNAMNVGNHDRSDIMSDYHDVGWYVEVRVGEWNKPYVLEK